MALAPHLGQSIGSIKKIFNKFEAHYNFWRQFIWDGQQMFCCDSFNGTDFKLQTEK